MNTFELLETKRKHVRRYKDIVPDKAIIDKVLYKAWKTTPSKNNSMAYQCLVWGPDKKQEKENIWKVVTKSHHEVEKKAVEEGLAETTQKGVPNPYYEHVKFNPYLFTIHARLSTPNPYYKRMVRRGHFYDQGHIEYMDKIIDATAVEVGLFVQNLTNYLLEEGLDMSYNSCFRRSIKEWHKVGLDMITTRCYIMVSCGYGERYRRQEIGAHNEDLKPEQKDIIKWI